MYSGLNMYVANFAWAYDTYTTVEVHEIAVMIHGHKLTDNFNLSSTLPNDTI